MFTQFGFEMMKRRNVTAQGMKAELQKLGKRNFFRDDALVRQYVLQFLKCCLHIGKTSHEYKLNYFHSLKEGLHLTVGGVRAVSRRHRMCLWG